jgi:tetratricopeptide (TPR) repeat protein
MPNVKDAKKKKLKKTNKKQMLLGSLLLFLWLWPALGHAALKDSADANEMPVCVRKAVYEAQQAMDKKEYADAGKMLLMFSEQHPELSHYLVEFTWGNLLVMKGRNQKAALRYEKSVDLNPEFSPAWQNLGKVYYDLQQYTKAGNCMVRLYELDGKKNFDPLYQGAVSFIMGKQPRKALPHLEYLASGTAGEPRKEWLEALLKVCMDLNLEKKALDVVRKVVARNEDDPCWWKVLAQLHLQQGHYKDAAAALTVHSYLTPLNRKDLILLGDLHAAIGVPVKAAACYEEALKIEQEACVCKKLAKAYIAALKPDKALKVLHDELSRRPTAALWRMTGWVYYGKEEFDKAYEAFEKSIQIDPKHGRIFLMMGDCAIRMKDMATAKRALCKAARFRKHRKQATALLKTL